MKRIIVDITHTAQLNFYLNAIKQLSKQYLVFVTVLDRGKLPLIAKFELENMKNISLHVVGRKGNSIWSTLFEANLIRLIKLCFFAFGKKIDLGFTNGYQACFVGRICRFPVITFGDDPQAADYNFKLLLSNKVYFCLFNSRFAKLKSKTKILSCVKEWAYLSTEAFTPDESVLEKYNLSEKEYIIVREVSTKTVNYANQKSGLIANIINDIPSKLTVLLSLEDKTKRDNYPQNWILLQEPISDFHSIIYYSKCLISSGDSMAREAAVLGIPGIYIGVRNMYVNNVLSELADFYHFNGSESFNVFLETVLENANSQRQNSIRNSLKSKFINVTNFINKISKKLLI
jgi:predicted glycosyltransferase